MQEKQWNISDLEIETACERLLDHGCTPLECVIALANEGAAYERTERVLERLGCEPGLDHAS